MVKCPPKSLLRPMLLRQGRQYDRLPVHSDRVTTNDGGNREPDKQQWTSLLSNSIKNGLKPIENDTCDLTKIAPS